MAKIVYNVCYGGFSLSDEAVEMYLKLQGLNYTKVQTRFGYYLFQVEGDPDFYSRDIKRHDPILVKVVELLGDKANGACAKLALEEVADGTPYRISEYDGMESVETLGDIDWEIAE
jgi:hypothetical protein